jgi:hypothetical protein
MFSQMIPMLMQMQQQQRQTKNLAEARMAEAKRRERFELKKGRIESARDRMFKLGQERRAKTPHPVMIDGKVVGQMIGGRFIGPKELSFPPKEWKPGIIEKIGGTEQKPYNWGDDIPEGWKVVKTASTQINIGDITGLTKATKSKLQQEIIGLQDQLFDLKQADLPSQQNPEGLFKREYLEHKGKLKGWISRQADKFGVGYEQDFLKRYAAWKGIVKKQTLAYRKLVTGVAGGPKEMKDIESTFINVNVDSPMQYLAKRDIYEANTRAAIERKQYALQNFGKDIGSLSRKNRQNIAKQFPFQTYTESPKDQYEVGAIYEDAKGNKMRYAGNGKWEKP